MSGRRDDEMRSPHMIHMVHMTPSPSDPAPTGMASLELYQSGKYDGRNKDCVDNSMSSVFGLTAKGHQHLLDNQVVICDRIAKLDTASLAARADHDGNQIKALAGQAKAYTKIAASAAELTVQAQPLLAAIQQLGDSQGLQMKQMQAQLDAIQAAQCSCTIM